MSWPRWHSRRGCSATSASSSGTTSAGGPGGGAGGGCARRAPPPSLLEQPLEAAEVELLRRELERVAGRAGGDGVLHLERLAELRHVHLQRVRRSLGRALA